MWRTFYWICLSISRCRHSSSPGCWTRKCRSHPTSRANLDDNPSNSFPASVVWYPRELAYQWHPRKFWLYLTTCTCIRPHVQVPLRTWTCICWSACALRLLRKEPWGKTYRYHQSWGVCQPSHISDKSWKIRFATHVGMQFQQKVLCKCPSRRGSSLRGLFQLQLDLHSSWWACPASSSMHRGQDTYHELIRCQSSTAQRHWFPFWKFSR